MAPDMAPNQREAGSTANRVAPWRERVASGMRLSVAPPPPPTLLVQRRRTLVGIPVAARPPAPPPARVRERSTDLDDEKEDVATDVFAEPVTLVLRKDEIGDDESTHEIPRPTLRRLPVARPAQPLPPTGFEVLSASLAAASLAPQGFTAALVRQNALQSEVRTRPARFARPSLRIAAWVAGAVATAVVALSHAPGQGRIVVDAADTAGAPVAGLEVLLDGTRVACAAAPCSLPAARGLHEVQVAAKGFGQPATQAVAVASGSATPAHFIVASSPTLVPLAPGTATGNATEPATASANEPAAAPTPEPARALSSTAVPGPSAPRRPTAVPRQSTVAAARASRAPITAQDTSPAYLNINSIPASPCYLDGKALGYTPRLHVETTAGAHTVRFRAADGSSKTVIVRVGAGETRLAAARLE
jgi:hypothetical protein